jgi:FMN phosphatase YigB (HAD superfamily)
MSTPPPRPLPELVSLQAILVDVDGTLYDQRSVRRHMLSALLRAHLANPRLGWKTVRCLGAFRHAQEKIRFAETSFAETGNLSHTDLQFTQTQQATGYSSDFVRQTLSRWMDREPLAFLLSAAHPGMRDFFAWAASRGIKLAALSDYPLDEKLKALGVADLFPLAVSASHPQVGHFKPHPAILEFALRQLDVIPGRALYLGDRPDVDGVAAHRAGVAAAILSPRSGLGWRNGLLYVRSFSELRQFLERGTTGKELREKTDSRPAGK